jgi:RNA polymerase sigma-70 factor (ECF subfamily)
MQDITDEALIEQWKSAASQGARTMLVERLFERHYRRVAIWCLRWSGDRENAKDLAQDVFLKVQRNLDSFQGGSKFTTWLYMVAKNHCINAGMQSRSRECVELDEALYGTLKSDEPSPEQELLANRRMAQAKALMERLDPTERDVLMLHYVEGWSLPMVTRALKLTNASGAKAYMVSGHRKLKSAVERLKAQVSRRAGGTGESRMES